VTAERNVLELENVRRSYGGTPVLTDVSFDVRPGRITGFVGANGAGKTTTMRIILGILAPDSGEVRYDGTTLTTKVRRSFGYMPEERGLYPKMSVIDQVVYFGQLHGMSRSDARASAERLTDAVGIAERRKDKLKDLSLGNQQRAQLAAALVHDPVLLVLDEPFSGLDPIAVDAVIEVLRRRAEAGVLVLFSSHQLELVENLCDDIVILNHGRKVAAGTVDELREETDVRRYRLVMAGDAAWVGDVPGVSVARLHGPTAMVEFDRQDEESVRQEILTRAMERGGLVEFARVATSLAEIFRWAVGR
jgi:ABC-2 type transport system ATP-binding protein